MNKYERRCNRKGCKLKAMTGMPVCYAHGSVSTKLILQVWRKLYDHPFTRVREMGEEFGVANIGIMRALQWLDDQGVLGRDRRGLNARHIRFAPITDTRGNVYRIDWLDL